MAWAETSEQKNCIKAFEFKKKIKDFDNNEIGNLIDVLGKWRFYLGVSKDATAEEFMVLTDYIKKNHANLTLDEIHLMIDLSLKSRLNVEVRLFGNFSPLYVSQIINAYHEYKASLLEDVNRKVHDNEIKLLSQKTFTPQDDMNITTEIIIDEYNHFKEHGVVKDYMNIVYDFMLKSKRMIISKADIHDAMNYGNIMANTEMMQGATLHEIMQNYREKDKKLDKKDYLSKRYARNYCLQKYFDNVNLNDLISSIKIDEFK